MQCLLRLTAVCVLLHSLLFATAIAQAQDAKERLSRAPAVAEFSLFPKGHSATFVSLAYSRDGKRLAAGAWSSKDSAANNGKVWDLDSGRELFSFKGQSFDVAFSPDGKQLAIYTMASIRLLNAVNGRPIRTLKEGFISLGRLAFSPDGTRLIAVGCDNTLTIWNLKNYKEIVALADGDQCVLGFTNDMADFSPDGKTVAVVRYAPHEKNGLDPSHNGDIKQVLELRDAASGKLVRTITSESPYRCVSFGGDNHRLLVVDSEQVKLLDVRDGRVVHVHQVSSDGLFSQMDFSANGNLLLLAPKDKPTLIVDVESGKTIAALSDENRFFKDAVFGPDGKSIALANQHGIVRVQRLLLPK